MNYHHLTIEERSCIRKYYVDGLSYREIARLIGRNVSTVSREIRRNCTHMYDIPTYYPHTAQKKYLLRRMSQLAAVVSFGWTVTDPVGVTKM